MADVRSLERSPTLEISREQELIIPASVLAELGFKPGQKSVVLQFQDSIRLIPLVSHAEARGSMPGLDATLDHEEIDQEYDPYRP
jgi:hypothetical protein